MVADLGYEYIELSPREDFLPFFLHPRVDEAQVAAFKKALSAAGVRGLLGAAAVPVVRPGRGRATGGRAVLEAGHRDHRRPRRGRDELRVQRPAGGATASEAQFWRSLEELLPVFEREGVRLVLEPHPDDFVEDGRAAIDLIRGIDSRPGVLPVLRAAHLPSGRRHRGDHALRRAAADPGAHRRLLRPPRPRPGCATS